MALHRARGHAAAARGDHIRVDHLWLGLLAAGEGVALRALSALGADIESLRQHIQGRSPAPSYAADPASMSSFVAGLEQRDRLMLSEDARLVLQTAAADAEGHIDTGHLVVALVAHEPGVGGLTVDLVRAEVRRQLVEFMHGRPNDFDPASADELIARPRVVVPPPIRALGEQIRHVQQHKETAIDTGDFTAAAAIREEEKQLLAERADRVREWAAGIDVLALVEEVEALRAEVDRLRSD